MIIEHQDVKKLSEEEKTKLRLEMENRAKDNDALREEKYIQRMNELKDKESKINNSYSERGILIYIKIFLFL